MSSSPRSVIPGSNRTIIIAAGHTFQLTNEQLREIIVSRYIFQTPGRVGSGMTGLNVFNDAPRDLTVAQVRNALQLRMLYATEGQNSQGMTPMNNILAGLTIAAPTATAVPNPDSDSDSETVSDLVKVD